MSCPPALLGPPLRSVTFTDCLGAWPWHSAATRQLHFFRLMTMVAYRSSKQQCHTGPMWLCQWEPLDPASQWLCTMKLISLSHKRCSLRIFQPIALVYFLWGPQLRSCLGESLSQSLTPSGHMARCNEGGFIVVFHFREYRWCQLSAPAVVLCGSHLWQPHDTCEKGELFHYDILMILENNLVYGMEL